MGPESYPGFKRKIFQKTQFTIIKVLECLCVILAESKMEIVIIKFFRIPKLNFNEIDYRINF